jgi:hypothetical protein
VQVKTGGRYLPITPGEAYIQVPAGELLVLLFSNNNPVPVSDVKFTVDGTTETLEVWGDNASVPDPMEAN